MYDSNEVVFVNPVTQVERLGIIMEPLAEEATETWGVLNPAVTRGKDGNLYLFARVVAEGNYSRIRMTRILFDDGGDPVGLERLGFALEPLEPYELNGVEGGCEDPRITYVPSLERYVMAYTAYGPTGPRIALAVSDDLFEWDRLGLVSFETEDGIRFNDFDNKDAFFFPDPVMGPDGSLSFACAHRPMTGTDQDGRTSSQLSEVPASIWVSYVPVSDVMHDLTSLCRLSQHSLILEPEFAWEHVKVGGGTPPVLTSCGWLVLHHGIEKTSPPGHPRKLRYCAGAFILDRWDLRKVVWRSTEPVMAPQTDEEVFGVVNNVVFPTGIDQRGSDVFDVYYGMADSRIGVGRIRLSPEAVEDGVIEAA